MAGVRSPFCPFVANRDSTYGGCHRKRQWSFFEGPEGPGTRRLVRLIAKRLSSSSVLGVMAVDESLIGKVGLAC